MATVAFARNALALRRPGRPFLALLRRAMGDGRTRTVGFSYLFAAVAYVQPLAYQHTYPTVLDRMRFAHSFADNKAVVLFYGKAYDLLSVGGYTAWRVGGTLAIFAAVFGLLGAVRALRAQEDAGRAELVLSLPVSRGTAFAAAMAAVAVETGCLWMACWVGLIAGGLPLGGSAYLAAAVVSVVPVFMGVGALASQLGATKRMANELAGGLVVLALVLRVIADTSSGAGWLRWATPLGWAEELRPFTGAHPLVLLGPVVTAAALVALALRLAIARDIGSGLLASRDTSRPHTALLTSPTRQTWLQERLGLLVWTGGVGAMALVIGVVSKSVSSLGISKQLQTTLEKLGAGSVLTPKGYIGFSFSFFVLVACLFAVSQMGAARHEEEAERLETLLALPIGRQRWLGGRLALAMAGIAWICACAGVLAWAGAVSQGVSLSLITMLEAAVNCLPAAVLFLGLAALAYAAVPRAAGAIAYGLVVIAYLWQLFGALLGAPTWLVQATPFAHVAAVPAVAFRVGAALVMVAIGLVAALAALAAFARRDLMGA
jgi:ABC-2 type transport system permease protein